MLEYRRYFIKRLKKGNNLIAEVSLRNGFQSIDEDSLLDLQDSLLCSLHVSSYYSSPWLLQLPSGNED